MAVKRDAAAAIYRVNGMNEHTFRFDLPFGWEDLTVYHFRGPVEGDREHLLRLVVDRHLRHDNVADFAREHIDPIASTVQSVEVMQDEEITLKGGNQAYEFVYKWIPADGIATITKSVFVIRDGLGYLFSCDFSKRTLKTVGAGMKAVIETLLPGTYEPADEA